jgi:RNA polymerase-binding transcription factor DksA
MTHDIQEDGDMSRTDVIDAANEIALRDNAEAVAKAREASQPERIGDGNGGWIYQKPDANGQYPIEDCVDCGDPIPKLRLELGRIRCVGCQTAKERRQQHSR